MSDKVVSLGTARAEREDDNSLQSPADALRDALRQIENGECEATSVLVLTLNRDGDKKYDPGWYAANLRGSEMIALMEVVKATILRDMGFT